MTVLAGRTSLVTGAGSGIGRLVAERLADRGARVVLWDLTEERSADTAASIERRRGSAFRFACDVGDRRAVTEAAARVLDEVGPVDILVNNAGVVSGDWLLDLSDEKIEQTYRVNTLALYWTTRAFLPNMIVKGTGHVVTVASAAGLVGVPKQTDYSGSKHAAVGFDESLRAELARRAPGVKTTVVCPFYINTGMFAGASTRFPKLLPILEPVPVADRIVRAIERDQARLIMPPLVRFVPSMRLLPTKAFDKMMDLFGVNHSMDDFVGRDEVPAPEPARLTEAG